MREIKFRSWDEYSETMVFTDGSCGTDSTDFVWQVEIDSIRCYKIDLITENYSGECNQSFEVNTSDVLPVMQYTGLKDKNGVEIYEGDICRCCGGSEFNGYYQYNKIYEVKWQGSGLEMVIGDCGYGWNYSSAFEHIEVIGNIYEDSHLLDNN